nr:hypothetical protein [Vibrio anguillarum]
MLVYRHEKETYSSQKREIYIAQCDIMSLLEDILKEIGPCLSTDLVQELVDRHHLSHDAARKRV